MKIFLIANNSDTIAGFRLAGVRGVRVNGEEEFKAALWAALDDKETGIVLIMDELYSENRDFVMEMKMTHDLPLIVQVPSPGKKAQITDAVSSYISRAVGMEV